MPSNFRPLISPDRETDLNTGHDWPILITWPEYWLDWSRLVPNEEETAAERCSEKLVDLVVLLTTKLDNNVEVMLASHWSCDLHTGLWLGHTWILVICQDLRKELTDNINENIERFERVQQQQEEEYGEYILASDWSKLITWLQYWAMIGPDMVYIKNR